MQKTIFQFSSVAVFVGSFSQSENCRMDGGLPTSVSSMVPAVKSGEACNSFDITTDTRSGSSRLKLSSTLTVGNMTSFIQEQTRFVT